jgi:hypothetical protein
MTADEIGQVLGKAATDEEVEHLGCMKVDVEVTHRRPAYSDRYSNTYSLKVISGVEFQRRRNEGRDIRYAHKGGETLVIIRTVEGNGFVVGHAECSEDDNFDRRRGIQIALGRALRNFDKHGWIRATHG